MSYNPENDKYEIFVPLSYPAQVTKENLTFAVEFIMEFALKLQEFKYLYVISRVQIGISTNK